MKNHLKGSFLIKETKGMGAVLGLTLFGAGGLHSQSSSASKFTFPELSFEARSEPMREHGEGLLPQGKILVTYASSYGSTGEIANEIGKHYCQKDWHVDILQIKNVLDITSYDAVIIGSPIHQDKWKPEAFEFVSNHRTFLETLPVAFFFTCLALSKTTPKTHEQAIRYAEKIYEHAQVKPVGIGRFAGVLDYSRMPWLQRGFARGVFAVLRVKEGDYRDWNLIHEWAHSIETKILSKLKIKNRKLI